MEEVEAREWEKNTNGGEKTASNKVAHEDVNEMLLEEYRSQEREIFGGDEKFHKISVRVSRKIRSRRTFWLLRECSTSTVRTSLRTRLVTGTKGSGSPTAAMTPTLLRLSPTRSPRNKRWQPPTGRSTSS